jgi:hypothetical protein
MGATIKLQWSTGILQSARLVFGGDDQFLGVLPCHSVKSAPAVANASGILRIVALSRWGYKTSVTLVASSTITS